MTFFDAVFARERLARAGAQIGAAPDWRASRCSHATSAHSLRPWAKKLRECALQMRGDDAIPLKSLTVYNRSKLEKP
jgi:hypothetical protein